MIICKFQTPMDGSEKVLIYSRDRSEIFATASDQHARDIKEAIGLSDVGGKIFAYARLEPETGALDIGKIVRDPGW